MRGFFARLLFRLGRLFIAQKEAKLNAESELDDGAKDIIDKVGR